jgi:hypothetical protein
MLNFSLCGFTDEPIPYPGFRGCFVVASSGVEPVVFVALTVIETGIVIIFNRLNYDTDTSQLFSA